LAKNTHALWLRPDDHRFETGLRGKNPSRLSFSGDGVIMAFMFDQSSPEIQRLRDAYAAFNARDIDAAFATMSADVSWPRAFKGGFVQRQPAIRAYWTEQWGEIDPHVVPVAFYPEEGETVLVNVHQVVRDLAGAVLGDEQVAHRFTMEHGLIKRMEICDISAFPTQAGTAAGSAN
jgi:hypothetical protein